MRKTNYQIQFVTGFKLVLALTELELYSLIRKYKVSGYKKVVAEEV